MRALRIWKYSFPVLMLIYAPSLAQAPRAVATITQLKLGKLGEVNVTYPGKGKQRAGGFQQLSLGTRIDVTNDATVEIYFFNGETKIITPENSPYEIVLPKKTSPSISSRLIELGELLLDRKSPTESPGQVRGGRGFILLAPRQDTRIMTRLPRFEWEGRVDQPATLIVSGPKGVVWSTSNLPTGAIQYPQSAPALVPDVYYSWFIKIQGENYGGGRFKILTNGEARWIKTRLAEIESEDHLGHATRRVLQINYLISQELYYEARERSTEALKANGDEPTLHLLLAEVYEKTGLNGLADEQVQIARDLATRDKNR